MTNGEKIKGLYSLKEYLVENPIELEGHKSLPITLIDYAIEALEQEPITKNNLGVDCISREQAINAVNMCSNSETILNLQQLPSITPQEPVKKLEEQIKQLQNRCHAFTHGQICVFCLYDCEHKAEVEPQERSDKE